ncbi:MAG: cupin domain-containing protein [Opitutales bacterium]
MTPPRPTADIPVHKKVWGTELWIANRSFCGKKLVVRAGYRCSIHWHEQKDETFYLAAGRIVMEVDGVPHLMKPGDKLDMPPGVKHRFTALEESELLEFSTHHEEADSYRDSKSEVVPPTEFAALVKRFGHGAPEVH